MYFLGTWRIREKECMSDFHESRKSGQPAMLVVGDWLVDEHWVVGKHRARSSSRTGHNHARALHQDECSVYSLCGAGQVATILHRARFNDARAFETYGIGIWYPTDQETSALAAMLDPECYVANTPHRLSNAVADSPLSAQLKIHNLEDHERLYNLAGNEGKNPSVRVGTTRVIRVYTNLGEPELQERIDWELPLTNDDLQKVMSNLDRTLAGLKASSRKRDIEHILIKDVLRGVVCTELIQWLHGEFPNARWYISSKDWRSSKNWRPEWFKALPAKQVELILIPQLAAERALASGAISSSWVTAGGVPSENALTVLDDLAEMFKNARLVVLPQGMSVLARDGGSSESLLGYMLPRHASIHFSPYTPMASVFFPSLVAQLALQDESRDKETSFSIMLARAIAFTETWAKEEVRRLIDDNWRPTELQDLQMHDIGYTRMAAAWKKFKWPQVKKDWEIGFEQTGVISCPDSRKEFHLWRGMTVAEGYITAVPAKRKELVELLSEAKSLVQAAPEDRQHKSFMIIDSPGSGKSFMMECLARTLKVRCLKFNVSQMMSRSDLTACFQSISAAQSEHSSKPLIVFIDEINALIGTENVYGAFLEPLEDGSYIHNGQTFHLAPCLWVFAGTKDPAGDKASDILSRLTRPIIHFNQLALSQKEKQIERIYLGVALIRMFYPEVKKLSEKVLHAFSIISDEKGPRDLKHFVKSFRYIQYGRVKAKNLPEGWLDKMDVKEADGIKWQKEGEGEKELVEIKSHAADYHLMESLFPIARTSATS
jgi:hypothetical protein